jgi:hypothetical protein
MRRLLIALAVAGLVAGGSGAVAQASDLDNARPAAGAVLTPDQIGITQPAQGFSPFFVGAGGSNLGGIGLGGVAPTTLGTSAFFSGFGGCGAFSISFCPFFNSQPFTQTFLATNGGQLGLGLTGLGGIGGQFGLPGGAINPPGFGPGNPIGTGGLGGVGVTGGVGGVGGISAQAFGNTGVGGLGCILPGVLC